MPQSPVRLGREQERQVSRTLRRPTGARAKLDDQAPSSPTLTAARQCRECNWPQLRATTPSVHDLTCFHLLSSFSQTTPVLSACAVLGAPSCLCQSSSNPRFHLSWEALRTRRMKPSRNAGIISCRSAVRMLSILRRYLSQHGSHRRGSTTSSTTPIASICPR